MQQVARQGARPTGSAVAIPLADARHLPVPQRRHLPPALARLGHAWVLHRKLMVWLMAAFGLALVLALVFSLRGGIGALVERVRVATETALAGQGFAITEIAITGQVLTGEGAIVSALAIAEDTTTLSFDAEAARARIAALPAVAEVSVRKVYPGKLLVAVSEKAPVARWRVDGQTFLIDGTGAQIASAAPADDKLPLFVGNGAGDDALVMIRALDRAPGLGKGLLAISRIADRRWDLIYDTGLRVQLPEIGVAQALQTLVALQASDQLMDRDVSVIDMRVPGSIALTPNVREDDKPATNGRKKT